MASYTNFKGIRLYGHWDSFISNTIIPYDNFFKIDTSTYIFYLGAIIYLIGLFQIFKIQKFFTDWINKGE
jgi:hypothetical protein